jgi:hypothetical protein
MPRQHECFGFEFEFVLEKLSLNLNLSAQREKGSKRLDHVLDWKQQRHRNLANCARLSSPPVVPCDVLHDMESRISKIMIVLSKGS